MRKSAIDKAVIEWMYFRTGLSAERRERWEALEKAVEATYPGTLAKITAAQAREREAHRKAAEAKREAERFVGNPPDWAIRLVKKYVPGLIQLRWRHGTGRSTTGRCWPGSQEIVVTAGLGAKRLSVASDFTSPLVHDDQTEIHKCVLLHEIAHALSPTHHHDAEFWAELHRLLVAEHLYMAYQKHWGRSGTQSLRAAASRARKA